MNIRQISCKFYVYFVLISGEIQKKMHQTIKSPCKVIFFVVVVFKMLEMYKMPKISHPIIIMLMFEENITIVTACYFICT